MPLAGQRGSHIRVLDGLRGVAVLMILVGHFYQKSLISEWPQVALILGRIIWPCQYGVQLFFVLSGFLITGILLDNRDQPGSYGKFYMRRFLRIFPLYYGALIVVLVILPFVVEFDEGARTVAAKQVWLWTYFANWPSAGWPWDDSNLFWLGHFWSLCVEEHFYIFWPTLAYLLSVRGLGKACVLLIALGLVSRSVSFLMPESAPTLLQWNTFQKIDGLAVGSFIAIALRNPGLMAMLPNGRLFRLCMTVLLGLVLIYVGMPRKMRLPVFDVFIETLVATLMGLVLLGAIRSKSGQSVNTVLASQFLVSFGKYSYGLYVIHGILRPAFAAALDFTQWPRFPGSPLVYIMTYYSVTIPLCFALAYISYHSFEKPFLRLKQYFEYRTLDQTNKRFA